MFFADGNTAKGADGEEIQGSKIVQSWTRHCGQLGRGLTACCNVRNTPDNHCRLSSAAVTLHRLQLATSKALGLLVCLHWVSCTNSQLLTNFAPQRCSVTSPRCLLDKQ